MIGGDEAQKSAAPPATAAAAARGTRPRWVPASRRSSSAAMVEEEEEESTASSAAAGGGVIPRSDTGVKARVISPGWWEEREREREADSVGPRRSDLATKATPLVRSSPLFFTASGSGVITASDS